ncbi:MAG: hypothetical protein QM500_03060 [Methylococcales bacterium]
MNLCFIMLILLIAWEVLAIKSNDGVSNAIKQAMPLVKHDYFDKSRNALVISLFNPGNLTIEVSATELLYKVDNNTSTIILKKQNYIDKPLVLDPGDTILIPLQGKDKVNQKMQPGKYWGNIDFKVPGLLDYFSLHHKFIHNLHFDQ